MPYSRSAGLLDLGSNLVMFITHKAPVRKTALMPILRLTDICKFQIRYTGTLNMRTSDTILKLADMRYRTFTFRQCPGALGFQILLRGEQRNIGMKK